MRPGHPLRLWLGTPSLRQAFGINVRSDEEIAEETPDEVEPVALVDAEVYRAAAKQNGRQVLAEIRHLAEANASALVLAVVLGRRLGRPVIAEARPDDDGVLTLGWSERAGRRLGLRSRPNDGREEVFE